MITPDMIGPDGRVGVWAFARKAWIRSWPIDAKEIVTVGAGSLTGPKGAVPPEPPKAAEQKAKPHPTGDAADAPAKEPATAKVEFPPEAVKSSPPDKPKKSGKK